MSVNAVTEPRPWGSRNGADEYVTWMISPSRRTSQSSTSLSVSPALRASARRHSASGNGEPSGYL